MAFVAGARVDQYGLLDASQFGNTAAGNEAGTLPEDLDYSSVEGVYDTLRKHYDGELSEQQLLDGLKAGLAKASGDPYTVYLTEEQAEQFDSDLNGTFSGIGAEIDIKNDRLIVVAPLDGFPAQQAGLLPQDVIVQIDGEDAYGLNVEEAVLKIRGEKGTQVALTVQRGEELLDFTITRDQITVPSVTHEILEGNIGYLRVSRFAEDTTSLSRAAAQEFKNKNVNGVILDLRNNSGGFLNTSVDVAGLWLNNQVIVEQKTDGRVVESLRSGNNALLENVPTIVLVNEGSASASEITAGALQDYGAARLVGKTTFGKGSVQALEEVGHGVLKVTVARWFTPNGQNIDKEGVKPDVEVQLTPEDAQAQRDPQRDKALELLR